MKKISGLFFLIILASATFAQIPNNSFENWTTVGSYSMPDQWDNLNPTTAGAGVFTCIKGMPGNPGSAFIKLISKTVTGMGVVPAVAVCGILDQVSHQPVSGFAFNQRPQNFTGKWEYMAYGIKPGFIDVSLTRWDVPSGSRVVVASLHKILTGMVMSWGNFSLPLVYQDGQYPDTCVIFLSASGTSATNNDYLWLDNLQFEGTVTGIDPASFTSHSLILFPNPARDSFTALFSSAGSEPATVTLFNLQGRNILQKTMAVQPGENKIVVDVKSVPGELYLVKLTCGPAETTTRIMIK